MEYFLWIGIGILVLGLYIIGTAFNNATKWKLGRAVGVSYVGVFVTALGIVWLLVCAFVKVTFLM